MNGQVSTAPAAAAVSCGTAMPPQLPVLLPRQGTHPAGVYLAEAYVLLEDATGRRPGTGNGPFRAPQRRRLAADMADIAGWTQLACSPANMPTTATPMLPDRRELVALMDRAAGTLHLARSLLQDLAAGDRAHPAASPVLALTHASAEQMQHAWQLIARSGGYADRQHVHHAATLQTGITRLLARLATLAHHANPSGQVPDPIDDPWWEAAVLLTHAHYAVLALRTPQSTAPSLDRSRLNGEEDNEKRH